MKDVLNLRFLLASLAGLVLLALAIYFLHSYQLNRQADFVLKRARQANAEKRIDAALRDYRNYLLMVPKNAEAQAEMGLLLADLGAIGPAFQTLETALRLAPQRADLRRRLVPIDITMQLYGDARTHLQVLLASSPKEETLWLQLGICQAGEGNDRAAQQSFETAIQLDTSRSEPYVLLAAALRRLGRPQEAEAWMAKLAAKNPESPQAHLLLAQDLAFRSTKQGKAALAEAEKAAALAPKDFDILLFAASLATQAGEYGKARGYAERAIAAKPDQAAGYRAMVQIEFCRGDRDKALASLRRGIGKASDPAELLWDLSQFLIQAGKLTEAEETVQRLRGLPSGRSVDPIQIDFVQGEIEAARRQWPAAAKTFAQVVKQLERPNQILGRAEVRGTKANELLKDAECRLAGCYREIGNPDAELAAYRKGAEADPLWPTTRLGVAATLASLGQVNEALEEYRQIRKLKGMAEDVKLAAATDMKIARLLLIQNLRLPPPERDWQEVESLLASLAQAMSGAIELTLVRADVLLAQGRLDEAEKLLVAARDKHPDSVETWVALIKLAQQQHSQRADELLDELFHGAEKKFGDCAWIRLARAARLLTQEAKTNQLGTPGAPAIAALAKLGEDSARLSPADRLRLHYGLALCLREAGSLEQARKQAGLACEDDRSNLDARLLLLDLAAVSNDTSAMRKVLDEIRAIQGDSAVWHYGEAGLQAVLAQGARGAEDRQRFFDQAFAHLAAAQEQRPHWARVSLLRARLHDLLGQEDQAIDDYLKAVDAGETGSATVRRAYQLLCARQRFAEADAMLRRLEQSAVDFFSAELGRMASEVSIRLDNTHRAVAIARRVAAQSNDWADHVWLGQIAAWLGTQAQVDQNPEQAKAYFIEGEKAFRRAVELSPQTPDVWVGLIRFLTITGRKEQATAMLAEAVKKIPAEKAAFALGPCYEILGRADDAAAQYRRMLTGGNNDPRVLRQVAEFCLRTNKPLEAEDHLQKILGTGVSADPQEIAWARRTLAGILRSRGDYADLLKAVELVGQNLANGATAEDLEAHALLLAVFPQRAKRREAIQELEKVVALKTAGTAEARFALASLYLREDDWPNCRERMRALLSGYGKDPRYVATYVALLLNHDELPDAGLWLERLDELSPGNPANLDLRVELLIRRRQVDLAIQLLRTTANREQQAASSGSGAESVDARILRSFSILRSAAVAAGRRNDRAAGERLLAEADEVLKDYLTRYPGQQFLRASVRMLQGKTDDALAMAEKSWPIAEPTLPDAEIALWIGSAKLTPEQAARLDRLLLALADKHARPIAILHALADLRMRYHPQTAGEIQHEILQRSPNDVAALNNLAWITGLQRKGAGESLELVNRAIALAGPVPAISDTRAVVLIANGRPQEALGSLEEALRDDPKSGRYSFHRALALRQLGQQSAAKDAFLEARNHGLKPEDVFLLERPDYEELQQKLGL